MKKTYIVDTNILLDDPNCIEKLINGEENRVIIPYRVVLELDKLKREDRKRHLVQSAVKSIKENFSKIEFIKGKEYISSPDLEILDEIKRNEDKYENPILVTNDVIFQLICNINEIESEEYKSSNPFLTESERYTGHVTNEADGYDNCFIEKENGDIYFRGFNGIYKKLPQTIKKWGIEPRNQFQLMAMYLMTNNDLNVISIQSLAGNGKSQLALACALDLLNKKDSPYKKIYISKPPIEVGDSLGFLPGDIEEKIEPYMRYLNSLITKLDNLRSLKGIATKKGNGSYGFNIEKIELLPTNYIRGMNIDDAIVILDEIQNLDRHELRTVLSRMGQNVKCFCLGDIHQIDNRHLDINNNGVNWLVKYFINEESFAHLVINSEYSRGPICDMVLRNKL